MGKPVFIILTIAIIVCIVAAITYWFLKKRKSVQPNDALVYAAAEAVRQNAGTYSGLYQGMYRLAHADWRAWEHWLGSMAQRTKNNFEGYTLTKYFAEERLPKTLKEAEQFASGLLEGARMAGLCICGLEEINKIEHAFVTQDGEEPDLEVQYVLVSPAFVFDNIVLEKGVVKQTCSPKNNLK